MDVKARPSPISGLNYSCIKVVQFPGSLLSYFLSICQIPAGRDLAWDCATGNGQAAVALAGHFDKVIATDASAEKVAHAERHPRFEYRNVD